MWPKLTRLNLNTVLVAVAWDWIEPEEGKFDFALVDGVLAGARKNNQRVVFLWFGSWKNGVSTFAPTWVKEDTRRFARVRVGSGLAIEMLSPFSDAAMQADTRAYVKFIEHLKSVDSRHTVLMIQLENEVGMNSDSRDRGALAERAFRALVPHELLAWLQAHEQDAPVPNPVRVWNAAGGKASGSWPEIFGATPAADELFMAWHYARYLDHLAAAGPFEKIHAPEQRRLARSARTDQEGDLAGLHAQIDPPQHGQRAEALGEAADADLGSRVAHRAKNSSVST